MTTTATGLGKVLVRPITYLQKGDVVLAEARRDGETAAPLTVETIEREAFAGTYRIIWQGLGPYGYSSWTPRETLYVFARP